MCLSIAHCSRLFQTAVNKAKMSSTDIEYHIKFPTCSPKQFSPNGEDDFVHIRKSEKCPVVFLLGWIGCQDKHLARYSEIYEEQGCITVRCCVPVSTLTMQHYRYPWLARKLLDLITDMSLDEHPIFYHVFSNGGCYLYQYLVNEMRLRESNLDIRGCIMDSAPGKIRSSSIFKTIMTLPIGVKPLRILIATIACIWMYILHALMIVMNKVVDASYLSGDVFDNLLRAPTKPAQLFVYSVDDKLVNVEDIEEFIIGRERQGVDVTRCRFQSSPHVMHLVAHRVDYLETIHSFLRTCLLSHG